MMMLQAVFVATEIVFGLWLGFRGVAHLGSLDSKETMWGFSHLVIGGALCAHAGFLLAPHLGLASR